ncbi:c-type cytochrome biogenesis protein CcmI [Agaribacter flavus]|uniref:C-type cytochrome biogenesis protein CcmI n=1 Tax=Agaribacter flavus TaxID=1902781 RepID=A0ABV7FRB4_9ALTE
MTEFYIYAFALVVFASLFVVVPIVSKNRKNRYEVSNANVVKQRMQELDEEVEQGLISEKDKKTALKELKLALYNESLAPKEEQTGERKRIKMHPLLLAALSFPAVLVGIVVYYSSNQLSGLQEYIHLLNNTEALTRTMAESGNQQISADDYAKYAVIIRHRLKDTPKDPTGWKILGQVQLAIGRIEQSIAAYQRALELSPQDTDTRYKYANALMAAGTENSLKNAANQVQFLIAKDTTNKDYRLLLTVIATQLGNAELAGQNFAMIKGMMAPESNFYQSLVVQLRRIGVEEHYLSSADTVNEQVDTLTSIQIRVELSEKLTSKLPDNGFLIVFAQDAQSEVRIPLAVKRLALSSFPVNVTLSTENAMLAGRTLDTVESVKLTARVSRDADVMAASGELEGGIEAIPLLKGKAVSTTILIDKEI